MIDLASLDGLSPEDTAARLAPVTKEMGRAIDVDPTLPAVFMDLLRQNLEEPIGPDTFSDAGEALADLFGLGEDPAKILFWLVRDLGVDERQQFLDAVSKQSPPAVARLLRDALSLYRPQLTQAYRRMREAPEDWDSLHQEVHADVLRGGFTVDLSIKKFSGEVLRLQMDPDSLVTLQARLTAALNVVAASHQFNETRLGELRTESERFWSTLEQARAAAAAEAGSSGAEIPAAAAPEAGSSGAEIPAAGAPDTDAPAGADGANASA